MTVVEHGLAVFSFALWVVSHLAAVVVLHGLDFGDDGRLAKEPGLQGSQGIQPATGGDCAALVQEQRLFRHEHGASFATAAPYMQAELSRTVNGSI